MTNTQTSEPQTQSIKTEFTSPAPFPVTSTLTGTVKTITEIETKSGLKIERGHARIAHTARRNLDDFYANFQVNDVVTLSSLKESTSVVSSMRYRGWKSTTAKQSNGTFKVQRLS